VAYGVKDIFLFLHTGSQGDGNIPLGQRRQRLFRTNIFLISSNRYYHWDNY